MRAKQTASPENAGHGARWLLILSAVSPTRAPEPPGQAHLQAWFSGPIGRTDFFTQAHNRYLPSQLFRKPCVSNALGRTKEPEQWTDGMKGKR